MSPKRLVHEYLQLLHLWANAGNNPSVYQLVKGLANCGVLLSLKK